MLFIYFLAVFLTANVHIPITIGVNTNHPESILSRNRMVKTAFVKT